MPQLVITFDPVPGATGYEICYKAGTDSVFTCSETNSTNITITDGIECGKIYDVTVKTLCPGGAQSTLAIALSNQIACPQPTWCYFVSIHFDDAINNYIEYTDENGQVQTITVNSLPQNSEKYYQGTFCSSNQVRLVNSVGAAMPLNLNSHISGGMTSCSSIPCEEPLYTILNAGVGSEACFTQNKILYSNCDPSGPNFGTGCIIYTDAGGTTTLTHTTAWINGTLYNINPSSGAIINVAETQCEG